MSEFLQVEVLVAFGTLTAMEIVLGIDNIVFLAIVVEKLRGKEKDLARQIGLFLAMLMRIALLLSISWIMGMTKPLFTAFNHDFSARHLILLLGGLFLIAKSTMEIHERVEGDHKAQKTKRAPSLKAAITQIVLLDLVFSLDSVITAIGMVDKIPVMIAAIVAAMVVMLVFSGRISNFVTKHPTIKMLAMAFLILIGVMLVAESLGQHVERGYIYFAMAFALIVEMLNLRANKKSVSK
jgi:predicted tellurium resistance membrane protein TerC